MEKGITTRNITFPTISLWVQVWGLPFDLMNEEAEKEIGGGLEEVLQVDVKAFTSYQARFLSVRFNIPLDKPLRRGAPVVSSEGDRAWVAFKYKRIIGLCYAYARLGHEMRSCPNTDHTATPTARAETPYGEWMKVGGRQHGEESKAPPQKQSKTRREATSSAMLRAMLQLENPRALTNLAGTWMESTATPASVLERIPMPQFTQLGDHNTQELKAQVNSVDMSSKNKDSTPQKKLMVSLDTAYLTEN